MSSCPILIKEIQRLKEELMLYSSAIVNDISLQLREEELLELRERLEIELSFLILESKYKKDNKSNIKTHYTKTSQKIKLSKKERLCRKLLSDPYSFFADSNYFLLRLMRLFFKRKVNERK